MFVFPVSLCLGYNLSAFGNSTTSSWLVSLDSQVLGPQYRNTAWQVSYNLSEILPDLRIIISVHIMVEFIHLIIN